jgi:translation initiation factor IF-2
LAKHLKLNIKNAQIAQAVNLSSLKEKISKKKSEAASEAVLESPSQAQERLGEKLEKKEEAPKIRARSKSAFADGRLPQAEALHPNLYPEAPLEPSHAGSESPLLLEDDFENRHESLPDIEETKTPPRDHHHTPSHLSPEALRAKLFQDIDEPSSQLEPLPTPHDLPKPSQKVPSALLSRDLPIRPVKQETSSDLESERAQEIRPPQEKLGPTGRHIKDLIPPPRPPPRQDTRPPARPDTRPPARPGDRPPYGRPPSSGGPGGRYEPRRDGVQSGPRPDYRGPGAPNGAPSQGYQGRPPFRRPQEGGAPGRPPYRPPHEGGAPAYRPPGFKPAGEPIPLISEEKRTAPAKQPSKFREFRDLKPTKKTEQTKQFDGRDRLGLRAGEDEGWRGKRKHKGVRYVQEDTVRPTQLKVRLPISIKELAEKMKLKASQLIGKLFLQGQILTLNDQLTEEVVIGLLGHDFGCEITIDTSEEERIRITAKTIREEISESDPVKMILRPPVVAFMGHVDHGKTSLIDAIRQSNRASQEAGAITQHIGAFRCSTAVGDITILDTPGHEAFSSMRARGADVTDIVVLVIAGDEGMRQQTIEALQHAKAAKVTIVVAINKSDKPNFNVENVYRQLSEHELLPEAWGGQTITINCSAVTKEGIKELLEMLALQAEVLELKADPEERARGTVIESEMHKGMGSIATVLVQNGTLKIGDSLVFGEHFGKVKTMQDENGRPLLTAGPATPVSITGLSGLPNAGQEFIVVKNEKEAREISEARTLGARQTTLLTKKKLSMDHILQQASETSKKILNVILRADMQGSLEALKTALLKIESQKAEVNVIFSGVGEISESDVQLAAASKALIIGFHTQIEGHADSLIKELGVQTKLHDIIYHAVDDIKAIMAGLLDKIAQETEKGKAIVKAIFKSSQYGLIAGCQVTDGVIARNHHIRIIRGKDQVWKGTISSLKRIKEDVREVSKGLECGILISNFSDTREGDIIESYEVIYLTQEL